VDENYIANITQDLIAIKAELASKAREWDRTLHSERQWKKSYDEVRQDRQKVLKELYDLQVRFNNTESQMKEIMSEYEERMQDKQWHRMEIEEKHEIIVTQLQNHITDQEEVIIHWKTRFSQLAALANGAIDEVPRMLHEADVSLMFFNLPEKVQNFLNHCKFLVDEMKNIIANVKK